MKKGLKKAIIFGLCSGILFTVTAGCQEKQLSDTRKSRLVATENIELKEQLGQKNREINTLKNLLEKCKEDKSEIQEKMDKEMETLGEEVMKTFSDYVKLHEENEELKKQIEELKKQ